jgi:uncharacterized protein
MIVDDNLALSAATGVESGAGGTPDAFAFIDLARAGRTDWWSGVKGLLNVVCCYFVCTRTPSLLIIWWHRSLPAGAVDVLALLAVAIAWPFGLQGALRSQRRPFLSLVSSEGRFRIARCWLGAGLWLGIALSLLAVACLICAALAKTELLTAFRAVSWPHGSMLVATLLCILLFPLQAAGEELVFRGWLTQTLGQFLRWRPLVVAIVACVFALAHGSLHGRYAFFVYFVMSVGLSVVTLLDRRIEIAIGAHAANNILAILGIALFAGGSGQSTLLFEASQAPWWAALVAGGEFLILCGVVYMLAHRRKHRLTAPG